jgi:predicted dehydrogenase
MINVGVIGVGYWGPNIVRNFTVDEQTTVTLCADLQQQRLDFITGRYPAVKTTTDWQEVVNNKDVDLVAVCTPVDSHYLLAKAALEKGKHVLIEKPMASSAAQADELVTLAEKKDLKIFIDHTFVYTGAVHKIKEVVTAGELGDLCYFDSVRINLGLFQHDVNVLWDLAPHDISIMHYLLQERPECVVATGADHTGSGLENVAYLTVYYPGNFIAHFHANWLSPVKIRQTLLAGTKKMIVWDDNQPSEKVRIYDKGIEVVSTADDVYDMLIQYRTGDMYCPKIDGTEALAAEASHIVDCIENGKKPLASGEDGLMVVRILEAAQESIKNRGKEVKI